MLAKCVSIIDKPGGTRVVGATHASPEVRGVALRVVLVLHWVIDAVTLPHQVVVAAQHGGVDLVQLCRPKKKETTRGQRQLEEEQLH